jgi:hypothetical protein
MRPEQAGSSTGAERFAFWSTSPKPSEGAQEYEFSPTNARDLVIDFSPSFSDAGGVINLATTGSACYECATQPFDQYPDQPTHLKPGKRIGFDLAVVDKDAPASSPEARLPGLPDGLPGFQRLPGFQASRLPGFQTATFFIGLPGFQTATFFMVSGGLKLAARSVPFRAWGHVIALVSSRGLALWPVSCDGP